MSLVYPDYENGLINVINSVEKYFKIENKHATFKPLDDLLKKKNYKNVILLLYDGLGYNTLVKNKRITPTLNRYLKFKISSSFPSTTMSSRTTIESGLNPVEHGWIGWNVYFKDFDKVITISRNYIKDTKIKAAHFNVAKKYLKYESIVDKINKNSDMKATKISVYKNHKNESLKKSIKTVLNLINNDKKNYIYFYSNDPDNTFHKYTCDSINGKIALMKVEKHFKGICKSVKDTLVIALADHGHVKTNYITLSDYPKLYNMLKGDISIDSRCVSFRVKEEFKKDFLDELKLVLKDDFLILDKQEVIEQKLFGNGKENRYFKDALGDYFAIGITNKAIRYNENANKHKSGHSGLTEDEMCVPLIIYEG